MLTINNQLQVIKIPPMIRSTIIQDCASFSALFDTSHSRPRANNKRVNLIFRAWTSDGLRVYHNTTKLLVVCPENDPKMTTCTSVPISRVLVPDLTVFQDGKFEKLISKTVVWSFALLAADIAFATTQQIQSFAITKVVGVSGKHQSEWIGPNSSKLRLQTHPLKVFVSVPASSINFTASLSLKTTGLVTKSEVHVHCCNQMMLTRGRFLPLIQYGGWVSRGDLPLCSLEAL